MSEKYDSGIEESQEELGGIDLEEVFAECDLGLFGLAWLVYLKPETLSPRKKALLTIVIVLLLGLASYGLVVGMSPA
jgi:hypothetical protein